MRVLFVALVLFACTGVLWTGPAAAAPLAMTSQSVTSSAAPDPSPDTQDPYLGQGDLITKAIPVCCCSSGFCEGTPGASCAAGGHCHCSLPFGNVCVFVP